MMRLLPAALAVALMTGSADALDPGNYQAIGLGTSSCGTWTAMRQNRQAFGFEQWILGYLSGVSFLGGPSGIIPLDGVDAEAVLGWIDNYCRAHPLAVIAQAGAVFVAEHPRQ
jgi:hypothetical protein